MTVAEMKTAPEPEFRVDVQDRVALLTFNRPKKLNALSGDLREAMLETFASVQSDDAIRAVVVTGAGRGFCSGADLTTPAPKPPPCA